MGVGEDIDRSHKLDLHPEKVLRVLQGDMNHSLITVEVGLMDECNHRCNYCFLDWGAMDSNPNRVIARMNTDAYMRALIDMGDMDVKSVYYAGEGENLMHSDFPKFVSYAASRGMKNSMSTNGTLLSPKMADAILPHMSWMRIGIDANTPETYQVTHGIPARNFDIVMANIESAARIKQQHGYDVQIGIQALALPMNVREILGLAKRVKDLGVDNIQVKPFASHPHATPGQPDMYVDPLSPEMLELEEAIQELDGDGFEVVYRRETMDRLKTPRPYQVCEGLGVWTLVTARGNVISCNMFYDNQDEMAFGNINQEGFRQIWEGRGRAKKLEQIAAMPRQATCGDYPCRPDAMNRHFHRLRNPQPNDVFI